jgi:extradiol dioxygenase family protein
MIQPFHLSFVVPDKAIAKAFYIDVLGCELGRDNGTWFDILFFGHQLTIHQSSSQNPAYRIDHFGPVLNRDRWLAVVGICVSNQVSFVMKPTIKNKGQKTESGKFLINDPSGNLLEFKYYQNFSETVG